MVFHPKPHQVNECSNLVTNFALKEVDGRKFLTLTKQVLPPAFSWDIISFAQAGDNEPS